MQIFTMGRNADTVDELWWGEHFPIFTQGISSKKEHLLSIGDIPVVQVDRGGKITYHGPGQLIIYCLVDIRRLGLSVRALVTALEQSVIELLEAYHIIAHALPKAPGVYIGESKIASLGLRIWQGCTYHGLSFNVEMDLEPFNRINPCGIAGLRMTQLCDLGVKQNLDAIAANLLLLLGRNLGHIYSD
jgi:lipoyl(octanoyl) transferase